MTAESRLNSIVVAGTVGLMLVVIPALPIHFQAATSWQRILAVTFGVAGSLGFYRTIVLIATWLLARWTWLFAKLLGGGYVHGTWIGKLRTKSGRRRLIVEHYEQGLSDLVVRGYSFDADKELEATWYTRAATIDDRAGTLSCVYVTNVRRKLYPVEGIGSLQFDRKAGAAPTMMSGYTIDSDASRQVKSNADATDKITYDGLHKLSDKLIPVNEAMAAAFVRFSESLSQDP